MPASDTTNPTDFHLPSLNRRAFLAAAAALTVAGPSFARRAKASPALPWRSLRDGQAFVLDGSTVPGGNCLAIPGEMGTMLIDAKFAWLGQVLREDARSLGGGDTARVALINTHHHADHTAGNWAFTDRHAVYAHPTAARRISEQHERYIADARAAVRSAQGAGLGDQVFESATQTLETAPGLSAERWAPTRLLDEPKNAIPFAGSEIHAYHFGVGHTDNDLVIHHPDLNVIHTGDLVFQGLHPFCDQSAGVSLRGWIASLWRVVELCEKDTIVIPGHGETGTREIVRSQIRYHEQLLDAVSREIDAGKSKEEITAMTFPFMEGLGFEQVRGRAISAAYDEIAND